MSSYGLAGEITAAGSRLPQQKAGSAFPTPTRSRQDNGVDYNLGGELSLGGAPMPARPLGNPNAAQQRPPSGFGLASEVAATKATPTGFPATEYGSDPQFGLAQEVGAKSQQGAGLGAYRSDVRPSQPQSRLASPSFRPSDHDNDAGPLGDNFKRQMGGLPMQAYPADDLSGGFGLRSEVAGEDQVADEYARQKSQDLMRRQTPERLAVAAAQEAAQMQHLQQHVQQQQQEALMQAGREGRPSQYGLDEELQQVGHLTPDQVIQRGVTFGPSTNFAPRPQAVPVIDIDKMPRYGLLSQPLPRAQPEAGLYLEFDREKNMFTRNRGLLREALEHKPGYLEERPVLQWAQFYKRQKQRYVPIPPDANRRMLPETQGYRLRILRVNDLPIHTTFDGRTFEFQLGVSLYDEAYGTFYGNTCYSLSDTYDRGRAQQKNAIDLDFSFDVYYHTRVSDPRCMAVVEVIMLERMLDGVVKGRYSMGWAQLPLFRVSGVSLAPGAPVSSVALDSAPGRPLAVPLVAGTPRYLLFRNVYNEDLRPPKVVPNCSILFQAEAYPAMEPYIPLLPEDFLVSYSDTIPGLRRFNSEGLLSTTPKTVISTLASPMLSPTYSIMLRRLQLALPMRVHDLLMTLDARQGMAANVTAGLQTMNSSLPPIYQAPSTASLYYTMRVTVHNGRTFVGPAYELHNLVHLDVPGWKVLQVPAPAPVFDYVMADTLTTIVIELLATPPQPQPPEGSSPLQYLIGWTSFVPFSEIREDGNAASVAVGVHRYTLEAPAGQRGLVLRDQPSLNWRAMLGDMMVQEVPEPLVEFQLFETARTPILPPLRKVFAVIEEQREQDLELGEQPLPQLLAPVQLPVEIQPPQALNEVMPELSLAPPMLVNDPSLGREPMRISAGMRRDSITSRHSFGRQEVVATMPPELADMTAAMSRQLEMLTRAVDELKDERKSLRNSMLALADNNSRVIADIHRPENASGTVNRLFDRQQIQRPMPADLQRFAEMAPTTSYGDTGMFSGAQAPEGKAGSQAPSRVIMQQLHDAGMVDALPADVQAMLRRRTPPAPLGHGTMPYDIAIEARDPRMASDVIVQFLAYRHHDSLNAPANLQSLYFTFQFYHFPPTTTEMGYLVPLGTEDQEAAAPGTCIIVPNDPSKKGAGLVLKYSVDGGMEPTASGTSPQQAAHDAHVGFCTFLAAKSLHVDVWDGESLLQVGSVAVDLQAMLRQGRDFSELLLELPVMDQAAIAPGLQGQTFLDATTAFNPGTGINETKTPVIISKGSIILRILNLGRESSSAAAKVPTFDDARTKPSRKRVRARAAFDNVGGLIAQEVSGGTPKTVRASIQQHHGGGFGLAADLGAGMQAAAAHEQDVRNAIILRSEAKSNRVKEMQELLHMDQGPADPLGNQLHQAPLPMPRIDDPVRRLQQQLLADVSSARSRRKHATILDTLRKSMVTKRTLRPGFGEVIVYEHEFQNPYSSEGVFEVSISSPNEVAILTRLEDYRALRAANARFFGTPSQPVGPLEQELMQGARLFLQGQERITLPFRLQSFTPPEAYKGALKPADMQVNKSIKAEDQPATAPAQGHSVMVEFVSSAHAQPVSVLELEIVPRPMIIDRTFRFYFPERSLLRQSIKLKNLPGSSAVFNAGVLRNLAVACSHPDVVTGAGSSGLVNGPERDEVYIKYKTGAAPEVAHFYVLLYADRLLARPIEVWQVFVHALRKVDMRAMIGQTSQASVVVRGVTSRRVAAFSSHPDELQVSPDTFVLVGGALTEVLLHFRPVAAGFKDIKVHLVDTESRELVYALIVSAEAQGPLISRTFEVELPAGTVANKKITYTNPYQQFRTFTLRCNQPWLMHFTPPRLQLPAGATRPIGLTFDARAATTGLLDVLVFVNDEEDKTEECFKVRVRIYR